MEFVKKAFLCLAIVLVFSLSQSPTLASTKSYIVYFGGHPHGKEATPEDYEQATDSHYDFLASFLGSKEDAHNAIFYSYTKHINGFAAFLQEDQVEEISRHPSVISIIPNTASKLHTTRSWELMGLEKNGKVHKASIWNEATFGKNTIIGSLDSGVWPESESFNDKGMGPVPSRWKGGCDNNTKDGVPCNRKLIGAKYFNQGYKASFGAPQGYGSSTRDNDGHGTHTLSTAAGSPVAGASFFGSANGVAKGGSPAARAAMYKVCWTGPLGPQCTNADVLAAFDEAIHDGVDVISVSLGGYSRNYLSDVVAVGSFHAVSQGISVVCSAGNNDFLTRPVTNTAPWVTTVAASTLDREFPSYLTLGNKKTIEGQSLESKHLPKNKFYPLITSLDAKAMNASSHDAELCNIGSLDPSKTEGKIVVCNLGEISVMDKGEAVLEAGGAGAVVVNNCVAGDNLMMVPQVLPSTIISYKDGLILSSYMNCTKSPIASLSAPTTRFGVKPTPQMAYFSSRGPSFISPQILKPDVTAPGVNILAAYTNVSAPTGFPFDTRRTAFNIMSGTSMSCPHVSGITGLLKTLYPHWSPAAIRSAIMTTARVRDNTGHAIRDADNTNATPFSYGSGHVQPNRATDPGLVYDLTVDDYLNFLCASGYKSTQLAAFTKKPYECPSEPTNIEDLNYPSIAVPNLNGSMTVTRTLKNVGDPGAYKVRVKAPLGVSVSVRPEILKFTKVGEEKKFQVSLKSEGGTGAGYAFGSIVWYDGKHYVRSPLAVEPVS